MHAEERSSKISLYFQPPLVRINRPQGTDCSMAAGIIDEDSDRAELQLDLSNYKRNGLLIRHIHYHGMSTTTSRFNQRNGIIKVLLGTPANDDSGSRRRQSQCNCPADAAATTGDERDLS